jgi:hypothetical protein
MVELIKKLLKPDEQPHPLIERKLVKGQVIQGNSANRGGG